MRPGMRHPPPVPPLRPPQRLMPAPNDGGVFFGGRDYARRQQQQQNYPLQKPLLPQGTPPQQWQNNTNYRTGPVPLIRPTGPWHPHGNTYHSPSPPPPPPLLHHHQQFNPNIQTPITYVPPSNSTTYELMRLANPDPIPFLEPHEDEDKLVRQHLSSNSNNDESLSLNTSSPLKTNKRRRHAQQQQQHENNRNVISYQDLDRPDDQRDPSFDNRVVPKSNKTNHLPSDKTNNHYSLKSSMDKDQALKLELDRIKKAGAQEREKLRVQKQAAAEKEKEAQMKKNSAKTGDTEKREDGELGDSSDDENSKLTPAIEQKRLKKIVDNLALKPSKSTISFRSKTPPSESIIDMSVMKLIRPIKLFRLDDDTNNSYREYLTTNFGRVRVHCQKPQPNFFSNLSCIDEIKRRLRLNNNSSSSILFRHLIDDNDQDVLSTLPLNTEPEDGEIESDDENTMDLNGKVLKQKSIRMLSDDDNEKQTRKKSKLIDDGSTDISKSSLNEKPWITHELRQLIKQRNKLQAQILNGETNADIEKRFKKIRNKISKHAKTLKAKYENSISAFSEPSLAPPTTSQQQSAAAATAANHPLSTILDPALVMAMLVNPSLYSHVQQQVLSNTNFMQAYQHIFSDGSGTTSSNSSSSLPPKVASETQVVPSTNTLDGLIKQATTTSKSTREQQKQQQQNVSSTRSRPVLTQATKPIQLTSLESESSDNEQRNKTKTRFTSSEQPLTESQQQDIALTQEIIRRQLALTQQQQRNQRNPHSTSQLSLSTPLSRHIPLTTEQMQEVLTRAKNYVTRQQSDETTDSTNTQPRLSYNTRRLQAAIAASASSATPQTAHTIGQAAAAAIAAVSARPSPTTPLNTPTIPKAIPSPSNSVVAPIPPLPQQQQQQQQQQQHPIRIQLDQKSKTLSSISNNQSLPIPTISQQKLMPLIDINPSTPPHMYSNPPNWQRPPHLPVSHYPIPPHQHQHQPHYPPYDNHHPPPYFGPRTNYPVDIRPPPPYGPHPLRHLSQPPRYNGPLPPPAPYGYGHPSQNYGPPPPPHPHYGHHYPPS